jgi:hypothetical protein
MSSLLELFSFSCIKSIIQQIKLELCIKDDTIETAFSYPRPTQGETMDFGTLFLIALACVVYRIFFPKKNSGSNNLGSDSERVCELCYGSGWRTCPQCGGNCNYTDRTCSTCHSFGKVHCFHPYT